MADKVSDQVPMEVYWTKDDSDESQSDIGISHVPGLTADGNKRPGKNQRKPSMKPQSIQSLPKNKQEEPVVVKKKHQRSASLKDLCPDDKRRVANLIKELAKVGEEKDSVTAQLDKERQHYEKTAETYQSERDHLLNTVKRLEEQQTNIEKERETLQKQFLDTQELLLNYQTKMLSRQEELNDSIHELVANQSMTSDRLQKSMQAPEVGQTPRHTKIPQHPPYSANRPGYEPQIDQRYTPQRGQYSNYDPTVPSNNYNQQLPQILGTTQSNEQQGINRDTLRYASSNNYNPAMQNRQTRPYTTYIDEQIIGMRSREQHGDIQRQDTQLYDVQHPQNSHYTHYHPGGPSYDRSVPPPGGAVGQRDGAPEQRMGFVNGYNDPMKYHSNRKEYHWYNSVPPLLTHHQLNGSIVSDSDMHANHSTSFQEMQRSSRYDQHHISLQEPVLSSTQRSDFQPVPLSGSQKSRTRGGEYEPLYPDSSNISSYEASNTLQASDRMNKVKPKALTPVSTNFHDHVDEKNFIEYYQTLSPDKRKRELKAQKEALLREQNRLRRILMEQEEQLRRQQENLHDQQMSQRQRLHHFEKTGFFPGNATLEVPYPIAPLPQQYSRPAPQQLREVPPPDVERIDDYMSETDRNLDYLASHGVDVEEQRQQRSISRNGSARSLKVNSPPVSGSISASTSPMSPLARKLSPRRREMIDTSTMMTQLTPPRDNALQGNLPLQVNRQKTSPLRKTSEPASSDRTMSAIDIIESMENQSPSVVMVEESVDEEAEESKILEEVFFLR